MADFTTLGTLYVTLTADGACETVADLPRLSDGSLDLLTTAQTFKVTEGGAVYRISLGGYEGAAPGILLSRLLSWEEKVKGTLPSGKPGKVPTGKVIAAFSGKRSGLGSINPVAAWAVAGAFAQLVQLAAQQAA